MKSDARLLLCQHAPMKAARSEILVGILANLVVVTLVIAPFFALLSLSKEVLGSHKARRRQRAK